MMGAEDQEVAAHLDSSKEDMESLVLADDFPGTSANLSSNKSFACYRSAMTTLSTSVASNAASIHPLSLPTTTDSDSDPLLSPPSCPIMNSSNSFKKNGNSNAYQESPSYADVIRNPLDNPSHNCEANGGGDCSGRDLENSESFPRSLASTDDDDDYLDIKVSSPQKEVDFSGSIVPGNKTYTTYLITTKTNISDYRGSEFSVRRRFRDVVTLSDRLSEAYRGFFIPPRPDKSIMERQVMQKQEFIEQRRVALEKYLRRLASHPMVKKSDELRVFLQVQGKLPLPTSIDAASRMLDGAVKLPKQLFGDSGSVMGPQDVVQPAKSGRDLLRLIKELKQSVANDWGGSKPAMPEEDTEFLENKERLRKLEHRLTNASKQAESLVKAQEHFSETMGDLGLAFIKLTKFENETAVLNAQRERAANMKLVANAAVKASRYYRGLNAQTVKHLDTLHDYTGLMLAVRNGLSDRSNALLTVQTLVSELSSVRSRAEKLQTTSSKIFGGDHSRMQKLKDLDETIRKTEDSKNCAIRQYERIKENNKSEIERLDRERKADFVNMLKGFVNKQVAYTENIEKEWIKVAEETCKYAK